MKKLIKNILNKSLHYIPRHYREESLLDLKFNFSILSNSLLDDSLKEPTVWETQSTIEPPGGELYEIWSRIPGAHKWHHYFPIYEKVLSNLRTRPIKVLEIGVYKGASSKMWKSYFHKDSIFVGVDIDSECKAYEDVNNNLYIRIGSQDDNLFIDSVITEFGQFDLIIDDGSHVVSNMIASFNLLFLHGLKDSGLYLAEDLHTNYWGSHRDQPLSFIDFSKHLIDLIHYQYTHYHNDFGFQLGSDSRVKSFVVPKITTLIDEIRFFDSIVVISKAPHKSLPISVHL